MFPTSQYRKKKALIKATLSFFAYHHDINQLVEAPISTAGCPGRCRTLMNQKQVMNNDVTKIRISRRFIRKLQFIRTKLSSGSKIRESITSPPTLSHD
jgi:hypothetical protein